jgi:hypothetical protein
MNSLDCPFAERDFKTIYNYLVDIPLHRLIILTQQVMSELSPSEALNYNINKFCQRYDDRQGRIAFLKKLVDDNIIMPLQYPYDVLRDPELSKLLSTAHYSIQFPSSEAEEATKEEVLTDELEVVSGPINITNPRWEHKDETKKEKSPDKASFDDTIILMADVTGIPESAPVTFDIYDTSEDPPMVVDSAKGKNENGVAKVEWLVTDKSGKGEKSKLEFEGVAKSKASERCEIPVITLAGLFFQIDLDNPHTDDDKIILQDTDGNEIETVCMKNEKEVMEDYVRLVFTKVEDGKVYNLIYDPGVDGFPYPILSGVGADFLKGKTSEIE